MQDIFYVLQWWFVFVAIGLLFFPLTHKLFKVFYDKGYLFSKVLGIALISYFVFLINSLHILKFSYPLFFFVMLFFAGFNFIIFKKDKINIKKAYFLLFLIEELFFLLLIGFWSFVRAHEPSIHGLEKFMDFGFINSILRSDYQPSPDMWFTPFSINYYYFGHFITALLTKLSFLPSSITYNLMIATIFSLTFSISASLGINFFSKKTITRASIVGGILAGSLTALGGNLHTIYSLFTPYNVDKPIPFWSLVFKPDLFPNSYWYPNATRFIPFTIHEFPIYSFVVSDLHGHVSDIPFVLFSIALTLVVFLEKRITKIHVLLFSLMISIMYMTNAWDAFIYFILISLAVIFINKDILVLKYGRKKQILFLKTKINNIQNIKRCLLESLSKIGSIFFLFILFSLPFSINFKPFVSGIGVLCAPVFLTNLGKIGPFLFEVNHCQKTPFWQLIILYGFFYFFVISFLFYFLKNKVKEKTDFFVLSLILVSTILIIVPEFFYVKDIYPAHYRANTMFKLVYQAFMMLSIVSAYVIVKILSEKKNILFYFISAILLASVLAYPYFAIKSYYGDLKTYNGLDGLSYMKTLLPDDYQAINWINKNIKGQPVILEAQGDSYTDYARISANTGLPTVLGWTVHEWLWRGTYDIPAPRIEEVRKLYESESIFETKNLVKKYDIKYVYIGNLEKEKYPKLAEEKFLELGKTVYKQGNTTIYKLD